MIARALSMLLSVAALLAACDGGGERAAKPAATPARAGIAVLDSVAEALERGDIDALAERAGFQPQFCAEDARDGEGTPVLCRRALEGRTPVTQGDDISITSVAAFLYGRCDAGGAYLTDEAQVRAAMAEVLAPGEAWSVFGFGYQALIKHGDGYVIVVAPADARAAAPPSLWYVSPGGEIVGVVRDCDGLGPAEFAERTGALARRVSPGDAPLPTPIAAREYVNPWFNVALRFPAAWVGDPDYGGQLGGLFTSYRDPAGREFWIRHDQRAEFAIARDGGERDGAPQAAAVRRGARGAGTGAACRYRDADPARPGTAGPARCGASHHVPGASDGVARGAVLALRAECAGGGHRGDRADTALGGVTGQYGGQAVKRARAFGACGAPV